MTNLDKLKDLLAELFMLDQADLDFGIYRVMNAKRAEVTIRGFRVVQGLNPDGEKVLVIWRNVAEKPNTELDTFFQKQGYNTKDLEFALIYVNGDNNLENLKRPDETWKVRRTEDEFKRLMFDVADV